MKKVFIIYSYLFFLFCSCQPQDPLRYYSVDGQEFQNIDNIITHEAHLKKMREIQMDINLAKGITTRYSTNLTRIKYELFDGVIAEHRRFIAEINSINFDGYNYSELDTMRARNGLVVYYPKFGDKTQYIKVISDFNSTLFSLDSLNTVIGLNK